MVNGVGSSAKRLQTKKNKGLHYHLIGKRSEKHYGLNYHLIEKKIEKKIKMMDKELIVDFKKRWQGIRLFSETTSGLRWNYAIPSFLLHSL